MSVIDSLGRAAITAVRVGRVVIQKTTLLGGWILRNVNLARAKAGAGEAGMTRLLDLHAASCAGDTLVTIGLAGTVFVSASVGEARSKVALYLLVTMVPFALLAPVVGPVLDRFRHGRRIALAVTMVGRAVLAWVISDHINGFGLYPAAFGVLALSRSYGVARSAAVPRLLPEGVGLSQAGARASVFGAAAGAIVAPVGLIVMEIGPQWPMRIAAVIFLIGGIVAMRLPPRADSDPPEQIPRLFTLKFGKAANGERMLAERLVLSTLIGSAGLRALYGFLLLFLAFAIKARSVPATIGDTTLGTSLALGFIAASLGLGSLISTAIGSGWQIRRPAALQAYGLVVVASLAVLASVNFTITVVALLCFGAAVVSGMAKLAVDASIQERVGEHVRASAFAHSETLLMLAWVAGGALGLIPLPGHAGIIIAAIVMCVAAGRAVLLAWLLRKDRLRTGLAVPATAGADGGAAEPTGTTGRTATATGPQPAAGGAATTGAIPAPRARDAGPPMILIPPVVPPRRPPDKDVSPPGYTIYRPDSTDTAPDQPRDGSG